MLASKQIGIQEVEEMLQASPEMAKELEAIRDAAAKVAAIQAAQAEIEELMAENAKRSADMDKGQVAAEVAAAEDVEAKALALQEAVRELEEADKMREAAYTAGRDKWSVEGISEGEERMETAKAGVAAALGGGFAFLPLILSQADLGTAGGLYLFGVSAAATVLSTVLFGVTYRYAVRSDLGNSQLKGGVIGAFGLVRGLGQADVVLQTMGPSGFDLETTLKGFLLMGESMLLFGFAAAAVEIAFQRDIVKPFPLPKKED
ncbi:hypothetical protein CYMTET_23107 [Cymbomonas tetramitiformis]|uniref:Uncharacterized protein n=1 Tax=Cymbomonas tetramitiformis TaxID=36881 RepID=A0AAE0FYX7_9CHLO|nr:hypothetical protein CYMTET_23107 [Cymbomonas tetramitiformis]